MSFLNPVNEPVLRFKSTDAGAPQINYNARTAGDVKAVLKACLVTGYGTTASAGWSITKDTLNIAEFASPISAMSDYKLGVDDRTAATTTWYYLYKNVRANPQFNEIGKYLGECDQSHATNGWRLLVTSRGILFVELVYHTAISKLSARITYLGQAKSALTAVTTKNMVFFNVGHNQVSGSPATFYSEPNSVHISINTHTSAFISSATSNILSSVLYKTSLSNVDLISPIFIASSDKDLLLGELPPILSKVVNNTVDMYGVSESQLNGRNVMSVCAGLSFSDAARVYSDGRTFLIKTDYWEY